MSPRGVEQVSGRRVGVTVVGIAHPAVRRARNREERVVAGLHALGIQNLAEKFDERFQADPPEVVPLASRDDRRRHLVRFRRREDEHRMRRRFFERFQERVKGGERELMHLVDDVDFVS